MAFGMALGVLDVETRGQQFAGWHVGDDALVLTGVTPEALKPTADFFDTVAKQADAELARPRRDRAQVQDDPPGASAADEQAALDELRKRD